MWNGLKHNFVFEWGHMCCCCCLHWRLVAAGVLAPSAHVHIWCKYLAWRPGGRLFGGWCRDSVKSGWMMCEWMCEEGRKMSWTVDFWLVFWSCFGLVKRTYIYISSWLCSTTCEVSVCHHWGCDSNPAHGEVYLMQHCVIEIVSDLQQVKCFLQVPWFPPPLRLTITI